MLDGGVKVSLFLNDKFTCASNAVYGDKSESGSGMGGSGKGGSGKAGGASRGGGKSSAKIKTISSMTPCRGPYPVKKGDSMRLVAEYDLAKHPLRTTSSGKAGDVMGMMGISFSSSK
jgi:hypothetical protein